MSKRAEHWRNIVAECENSQMKKSDWLELHSINPKTYYRWHRQLKIMDDEIEQTKEVNTDGQFGELCPVPQTDKYAISSTVIHLGNTEIVIDNSMSEDFIAKVIKAISNA